MTSDRNGQRNHDCSFSAFSLTGQRDVENLLHPYTNLALHQSRGPVVMEGGRGIFVYDDSGKEYIEGISGLWCTSLGFGEEELIEAAVEQMRRLPFYHPAMHKSTRPLIDLAEKLKEIAPGEFSKVFFVCSGSEANDTQIKLLWYFNNALGRPEKKKIISRIKAYHGSTIASASLTGLASCHMDFDLPIPQVKHLSCPHHYHNAEQGETEEEFSIRLADELEQLIIKEGPETIAAFIAEPVMAAGGVILPPEGYFPKMQAVLRKYDIRFISDEVICGFARTGKMWGAETFNMEINSLSCAKALSSGYLPIGAVLIDEAMYEAILDESRKIGSFNHGFTFGGHPTPAAVALRTIQIMEERRIPEHVERVAPRFLSRLKALGEHPIVGEARGVGLLGAVEMVADKSARRAFKSSAAVGSYCAARCEHHGLIARPLGDVIALCPPLVISEIEIDEMFKRLEKALDDTELWATKQRLRSLE